MSSRLDPTDQLKLVLAQGTERDEEGSRALGDMISHQRAKRLANEHLRAAGASFVATQATRHSQFGVWVIGYRHAAGPDVMLDGGGLVVTDDGEVHDLSSAPGALDNLLMELGRWPGTTLGDVFEREGESLMLLADIDPEEAAGLAAWAASRMPWPRVLGEETSKPYFNVLMQFLAKERARREVYPAHRDVYAAFHLTPYEAVRVVILGQDPYPNPGQANGLCFSVPRGIPKPRSLANIHAAMQRDGFTPPEHGDLAAWATQGVFLLNTALTVRRNEPNSHAKAWAEFTDAVIMALNAREEPVVFVLWGRKAQKKKRLIDTTVHDVVESPHPAARGQAQIQFRESMTFSTVNRMLDGDPIDWSIP